LKAWWFKRYTLSWSPLSPCCVLSTQRPLALVFFSRVGQRDGEGHPLSLSPGLGASDECQRRLILAPALPILASQAQVRATLDHPPYPTLRLTSPSLRYFASLTTIPTEVTRMYLCFLFLCQVGEPSRVSPSNPPSPGGVCDLHCRHDQLPQLRGHHRHDLWGGRQRVPGLSPPPSPPAHPSHSLPLPDRSIK
jgi:hypothetical protein